MMKIVLLLLALAVTSASDVVVLDSDNFDRLPDLSFLSSATRKSV